MFKNDYNYLLYIFGVLFWLLGEMRLHWILRGDVDRCWVCHCCHCNREVIDGVREKGAMNVMYHHRRQTTSQVFADRRRRLDVHCYPPFAELFGFFTPFFLLLLLRANVELENVWKNRLFLGLMQENQNSK